MQNFTLEQQMKAAQALAKKKEADKEKDLAICWRVLALLEMEDTLLPYRISYDLERAKSKGILKNDVVPNKYYPLEELPPSVECLRPIPECNAEDWGTEVMRLRAEMQVFEKEEAKYCINKDNWEYYFAHFLLPYNINDFTSFDITGRTTKIKDWELSGMKEFLLKVQRDCAEHPEKYYKGNDTVSCNVISERED